MRKKQGICYRGKKNKVVFRGKNKDIVARGNGYLRASDVTTLKKVTTFKIVGVYTRVRRIFNNLKKKSGIVGTLRACWTPHNDY